MRSLRVWKSFEPELAVPGRIRPERDTIGGQEPSDPLGKRVKNPLADPAEPARFIIRHRQRSTEFGGE
jgi:hypothetical protein